MRSCTSWLSGTQELEARQRREAFLATYKTQASLRGFAGEHATHLSLLLAALGALAALHKFSTERQNQATIDFMTKVRCLWCKPQGRGGVEWSVGVECSAVP